MDVHETTLKTRNGDLLLRRAGKGPTLLFLHGAGGVPGWLPFFDQLSDRSRSSGAGSSELRPVSVCRRGWMILPTWPISISI